MESLNDRLARARVADIRGAYAKTFDWLFDTATVTFATWLQQTASASSQIYWIQGKPGSGKSTLMKFGMRDPRFTELLYSPNILGAARVSLFKTLLNGTSTHMP